MKTAIRNGSLFNHLPMLFDDFLNRDLFNSGDTSFSDTNTTVPAVNIKETADRYEVEVAAPGMSKEDFKIELDGTMLTISSEKTNNYQDREDERFYRREFSYQSFQRSFNLKRDVVDSDKIEARYDKGVLQLLIPKKEEAKQKPRRLIQIS
ncbi:MAG: Hsp20/alpha crystallin family protein [Chitinophagaceae bacterium]|nr:Hsp20/alpha crystallin family protein [Chitinophagaceae bacterium]